MKWGLAKYNKEKDMIHILRKNNQRAAIGKSSQFRVHGKVVDWKEIERYFSRKKELAQKTASCATPPYICCRTPPAQEKTLMAPSTNGVPLNFHENASMVDMGWESSMSLGNDNAGFQQWTFIDTENILSTHLGVPPSPSLPQTFLIPEALFSGINIYISESFQNGTWIIDGQSACTAVTPDGVNPTVYVNLNVYCKMAFRFIKKGCVVEFGRVLSKAFGLVQPMLFIQHPRTLDSILSAFFFLKESGLQDVALLLRDFVGKMATEIIAKNHPWRNICQLFATFDVDLLDQALRHIYQCVIDTFRKSVGPLKRTPLRVRLELIQFLYGYTDLPRAERLFRDILASGVRDPLVRSYLGDILNHQKRYREAEQIKLDMLSRADEDEPHVHKTQDKAETLKGLTWSQYNLDKKAAVEKSLREAIGISVLELGTKDPWTIDIIDTLRVFLREWGREAEADRLRLQINN
jgi:hypothetical protein